MPGHPRHQKRQFTITVHNWHDRTRQVITAEATFEDDAVLKAGMILAARLLETPGGCRPEHWDVTSVHDPAPLVVPPAQEPGPCGHGYQPRRAAPREPPATRTESTEQ